MNGVSRQQYAKPRVPQGIRVYALSDIHGRADLLQQMFRVIDRDIASGRTVRPLHVFLGDYIDRGLHSRETIDLLIERAREHECIFLKGNHEGVLLEVFRNPHLLEQWRQFGGLETLLSYGVRPSSRPSEAECAAIVEEFRQLIPPTHLRFFQRLRLSFTCGDFFFVHAGVRPGLALNQQTEDDLCWIRDEFLESTENFGKYVVHGHTPVSVPDIRPNRANIDTGAYATNNLTLLSIQGQRMLAV